MRMPPFCMAYRSACIQLLLHCTPKSQSLHTCVLAGWSAPQAAAVTQCTPVQAVNQQAFPCMWAMHQNNGKLLGGFKACCCEVRMPDHKAEALVYCWC